MFFEGTDGSFCPIVSVVIGSNPLEFHIGFRFDGIYEEVGLLIVQSVEDGFYSCFFEIFVAFFISSDKVFCLSAFDRFSQDRIGVKVVQKEDVVVAIEGGDWGLAWEIGADDSLEVLFGYNPVCYLVASLEF